MLLSKPSHVFHGERSEKLREAEGLHDFPLRVVFDGKTSGLEASTKFKCNIGQVLGGRYKVLQYLGTGTFCHAVQCEDMRATSNDQHRFVCVKVSKNTKDIFDQNLWEVKLLKMLHDRISDDQEASGLLPALLDVFYYRETLFTVLELLRDNLYVINLYVREKKLPLYFTLDRCREVARQVLHTLKMLHAHGVIHADLKPENILVESLAKCRVKVIDYSNAYLVDDERCSYIQSRAYRAPEVVLGVDYSPKVDLWSLGCILMELVTGKLLFDNTSVKALLASHIALRGMMPSNVLKGGKLTRHYFASGAKSPSASGGKAASVRDDIPALFLKDKNGDLCRLTPHCGLSIERVLEQHGIDDPQFNSLICELLTLNPELRPSASAALEHPFLTEGEPGVVEPYMLPSDTLVSEEFTNRFGSLRGSLREDDGSDPEAEPQRTEPQRDEVEKRALENYASYFRIAPPLLAPTLEQLRATSAGVEGWANANLPPAPSPAGTDAEAADGKAAGSVAGTDGWMIVDKPARRQSAPASLRNSRHHADSARGSSGTERHSGGSIEDETPGPLTPPDFRAHSERDEPAKPAARSQERRGSMDRLRELLGRTIKGKGKKKQGKGN